MAFNYKVGLHNVGSYQVSGIPFASGGISCAVGVTKIKFPSVTSWIAVQNNGNKVLRVGFSEGGIVDGDPDLGQDRYFFVAGNSGSAGPGTTGVMELKLSELYLQGGVAGQVSVVAGLTFINTASINNAQVSPNNSSTDTTHTNWSGSLGV